MRKFAILFLFTGAMLHAQISNPSVRYVSVAPSGSCAASPPIQIVISTGVTSIPAITAHGAQSAAPVPAPSLP